MRKKGWFMIASVVLAAVAAGCGTTSPLAGPGTTVATTPTTTVPKKASIHNPAHAKVTTPSTIVGHPVKTRATAGAIDDPALGDLATVDACSLIPVSGFRVPAAYAKKSDLQLQQYAQYGECEAIVVLKHNEDGVYVAVQGSYSPHSASLTKYLAKIPSRVEKAGKLRLLFPDHQTYSSSCFVGALTPGDTLLTITVTTNTTGKGGTQAECPLAAIAAKEVAATVNAGRVRHFTWPADSMGGVNTCTLLTKADVARQLPAATTVDKSSDGHSCSWAIGRTSNGVAVTVNLESQRMTLASQQNLWHYGDNGKSFPGKAVTIDGRVSVVGPPDYLSSGAPSCAVQTNARAWPHGLGNDTAALKSVLFSPALYEVPEIYVTDNLPQSKLCAIATALATKAWTHLRA